jgi:hypothetical protein
VLLLAPQVAEDLSLWFLMGMLSSSCCIVQLVLSALSFGCAGFNTWLGPVRPLMLAITTWLQLYSWSLVLGSRWYVDTGTYLPHAPVREPNSHRSYSTKRFLFGFRTRRYYLTHDGHKKWPPTNV